MVILYTLPTCGICKMMKKKMEKKNISFKEVCGEEFFLQNGFSQAPVLLVNNVSFTTPTQINDWINSQGADAE